MLFELRSLWINLAGVYQHVIHLTPFLDVSCRFWLIPHFNLTNKRRIFLLSDSKQDLDVDCDNPMILISIVIPIIEELPKISHLKVNSL